MITRIVKMHFTTDTAEDFLEIFGRVKDVIRHVDGCSRLELHRDADDPTIFYTLSEWSSPAHLETYRKSELFKNIWGNVKKLFAAEAEAFSLENYMEV